MEALCINTNRCYAFILVNPEIFCSVKSFCGVKQKQTTNNSKKYRGGFGSMCVWGGGGWRGQTVVLGAKFETESVFRVYKKDSD